LNQSILTWDNLIRRGFNGPGICVLCAANDENIDHLFVFCRFTRDIWCRLGQIHEYAFDWKELPLEENFRIWALKHHRRIHLPILVSWTIWRARNSTIFEQTRHSIQTLMNWIFILYNNYPNKEIKNKRNPPSINTHERCDSNKGTFDGAEQLGRCGGGGTITLLDGRFYHFKVGLGEGTNFRAELLSLWSLLWLAKRLNCESFQAFGDSLGIIDWVNEKSSIRNTVLTHWYQRVLEIKGTFTNITIHHIYRELNDAADNLSKAGLLLEEGILMCKEVCLLDTDNWETVHIY